jgi:hypothetical protein
LNLRHTDPESVALSELSYGGVSVCKERRGQYSVLSPMQRAYSPW